MTAQQTTLVLVRHGHTAQNGPGPKLRLGGITDFALSELGHAEAARLARALAARAARFDAIWSSPLRRARDTASYLLTAGLGPLRTDPDLREIDCGQLEGVEIERVEREHAALWRSHLRQDDDDFCWPGGESYRAFRARCLSALGRLSAHHPGARVLVVTHAGVVSQVVGSILGTPAARWELHRPGNASITELVWTEGGGRLVRFDDRAHL